MVGTITPFKQLHIISGLKAFKGLNHLVIAGDGATVKIVNDIKYEYGSSHGWVIPYLGDWYLLKIFEEVLMKIHRDAGLKGSSQGNTHAGYSFTAPNL